MLGDHNSKMVASNPNNTSHQRQAGGGGAGEGGSGSRGGPELAGLVKWRCCMIGTCHLLDGSAAHGMSGIIRYLRGLKDEPPASSLRHSIEKIPRSSRSTPWMSWAKPGNLASKAS